MRNDASSTLSHSLSVVVLTPVAPARSDRWTIWPTYSPCKKFHEYSKGCCIANCTDLADIALYIGLVIVAIEIVGIHMHAIETWLKNGL